MNTISSTSWDRGLKTVQRRRSNVQGQQECRMSDANKNVQCPTSKVQGQNLNVCVPWTLDPAYAS